MAGFLLSLPLATARPSPLSPPSSWPPPAAPPDTFDVGPMCSDPVGPVDAPCWVGWIDGSQGLFISWTILLACVAACWCIGCCQKVPSDGDAEEGGCEDGSCYLLLARALCIHLAGTARGRHLCKCLWVLIVAFSGTIIAWRVAMTPVVEERWLPAPPPQPPSTLLMVAEEAGVQYFSGSGSNWAIPQHSSLVSYACQYGLCTITAPVDGTAADPFGQAFDFAGPNTQALPYTYTIEMGYPYTFTHWRVAGHHHYAFGQVRLNAQPAGSSMTLVEGSQTDYSVGGGTSSGQHAGQLSDGFAYMEPLLR